MQRQNNLVQVIPAHDIEKVSSLDFKNVDGIEWGETREIQAKSGTIKITAINAHHSEIPQIDAYLGKGNGYWIEFSEDA